VTRVVLASVAGRWNPPLTWELPEGVVALVDDMGAFSELASFVSGVARPRKGAVRIDGVDPHRSPETRRRIGSLLEVEEPLEGATVGEALDAVLALRGSGRSAWDVLEEHRLGPWLLRQPGGLSAQDRRRLALAVALASDEPRVVVLVEPLSVTPSRSVLADALAERARRGAAVLCITANVRDATDLGGRVFGLRPGGSAPVEEPWASVGRAGGAIDLVVHAADPGALAAALSTEPAVASVVSTGVRSPTEVVVRGPDVELASLAVMRAAAASGVRISSLSQRVAEPAAARAAPLVGAAKVAEAAP
jgi:ABC-type multidrug transport system ATPase subunit